NAHSYRRADDPASLTKAIKEVVLAEISPKVNPELAKELNDDVAGFPDEVAMAIISTLSEVDNMLIGEKPKPKPAPAKTEIVQQSAPASQQSTSSAEPAAPQTQSKGVPCFFIGLGCFMVVLVVVVIARDFGRW
ncbi:MAG: hypothetical protein Q8N63_02950, partial [Nanoarchaeota archaeon]|nr:hypothetical protein [Nanoarchaeota archaeon]